jgi:hypothetical protein
MRAPFVRVLTLLTSIALTASASPQAIDSYLHLPLAFERRGARANETFVARGQGYAIGVQRGKATIQTSSKAFSLEFAGAKSPAAVTGSPLPGKVNYIHGNNPKKWQIGLSTYGRVTYPGLYPGVDLVYYGNQQEIEFDLAVKPGADPQVIRMKVGGGAKLAIDGSGDLRIGEVGVKIALPKIYQDVNGTKQTIAGRYTLRGRDEVGFEMATWDRARPLVIDPTILVGPGITLSTLVGGSTSSTNGESIALDSTGNIYVAGSTSAADFVTGNQAQSGTNGGPDGFVTKVSAAGKLVYSTYFGGSSADVFYSVAADANGNAWVTGYSSSTDFPLMNATQPAYGGGTDAVVVEFTSSGALAFSTYLGGSSKDEGFGIAVDKLNNAYITGYTNGAFQTTPGVIQSAPQGGNDIFVAKYSSADTVVYATLLGGSGSDEGSGIAVDSTGNAYITGPTSSAAFVPANPAGGAQAVYAGGTDAFVAKLNPTATALVYFTYLGGSSADDGYGIAVDSNLNAYIAGYTQSAGLATPGAAQTVYAGGIDGLAAQLNPAGTKFNYITYLGGSRNDYALAVAADSLGNAYVTGYTDSANLPTVLPLQAALANPTSLLQTTNSGTSWSAFDGNIPGAVSDVSPDPVTSGTIVAVTELGIYRTTNNGGAWTPELAGNFASLALARSPVNPSTIYLLQGTGETRVSTDNGVAWTVTGTGAANVPSGIVADGVNANTAYSFSISQGIFVTINQAVSWTAANKGLPNVNVVAMAAGSDGSIYAAVSNNGIYKSTNQGATWAAINSGIPAPNTPVAHSIWVNPKTPSDLAFSTGGHVYLSTNGGTSWSAAASFFPGENSTAISGAADGSILYAATTSGSVYSLTTAANPASWVLEGAVLATSGILSLSVDPLNDAHVFAVVAVPTGALVAKINSTGSAFLYSTYLGGIGATEGTGIVTAGTGQIAVTGYAVGTGFPVTVEHIPSTSQTDAFAAVIADAAASCTYEVNPSTATVTGIVQTLILSVTAPNGCSWTAGTFENFLTVAPASSSGSGIVIAQISANGSGSTRTATLNIAGQGIALTQSNNPCTYTLDQSTYFEPTAGATFTANLTTQAGCAWAVENVAPYAVAINSGASGTGPGPISITVGPSANGNQRNLSLPVAGTTIDITQYGTCTYTPASTSVNAPASGVSNSVSFTASASYCSSFPVLLSNAPWLTVTGSSLGLNYIAAANTGAARSGMITIAGGGTFTVNQSAAGGSVPAFFNGEDSLSGGVYYLQFPDGNPFGYYNFPSASILYHYDMGFEAFVPGSAADVYLYDFMSTHWWYTSTTLFPYLYDFTLSNWLYYFPNTANPGHYTANPRYFSDLTTGKVITQ